MAAVDPNQLGTGKQILGVIWLGLFPTMTLLCRLQGPRMGARGLGSYQNNDPCCNKKVTPNGIGSLQ